MSQGIGQIERRIANEILDPADHFNIDIGKLAQLFLSQLFRPSLVAKDNSKRFAQIFSDHPCILPASKNNLTGTIGGVFMLAQ